MKIEVNLQKKYFFVLLGALLIIAAGVIVYAYNSNPTNDKTKPPVFGHSGDEMNVVIGGNSYTLQDAINRGLIGSGGSGSSGGFTNFIVFDYNVAKNSDGTQYATSSNGQYTWTVPAGVSKAMIEVWGAGGGGHVFVDLSSPWYYYSAGGGGGYGKGILTLSSTTYPISVGSGGIASTTSSSTNGGKSSFGTLISANGGEAGSTNYGGNGGSASAQMSIMGQSGVYSKTSMDSGLVVMGGASPLGGGSFEYDNTHTFTTAIAPGGGGPVRGGFASGGADGRVVVWW